MTTSPHAQAILLLTAHLGKAAPGGPRPLSVAEWGRFALWLKQRGALPEALLTEAPEEVLADWLDRTVTLDRVRALMERGAALALAAERWQRAGLWVLTRSDAEYPERLKRRLRNDSPPVLFGCGDRGLLSRGGIAVVGSREASEDDLAFAARLAGQAAAHGFSVVSGGARGIDETAMLGALQARGTAVGVLADSLLRAATSAKFRPGLMSSDLVLVSPFNPEAGFDVGNAMARNKYIYCLADAAAVVCSTREKGGTWNGAVEDLRHGWVPLLVQPASAPSSGNGELVRLGARWLPEGELDPAMLAEAAPQPPRPAQEGLFEVEPRIAAVPEQGGSGKVAAQRGGDNDAEPVGAPPSPHVPADLSFYDLFLARLRALTAETPTTLESLLDNLDLDKKQLQDWLKRAVETGQARRLTKPVRYQWQVPAPQRQPSMFGG